MLHWSKVLMVPLSFQWSLNVTHTHSFCVPLPWFSPTLLSTSYFSQPKTLAPEQSMPHVVSKLHHCLHPLSLGRFLLLLQDSAQASQFLKTSAFHSVVCSSVATHPLLGAVWEFKISSLSSDPHAGPALAWYSGRVACTRKPPKCCLEEPHPPFCTTLRLM